MTIPMRSGVPFFLAVLALFASGTGERAAGAGASSDGEKPAPPVPVGSVDLNRYAGLWHEIARIPNRFQKQCASDDITAYYELRDDGRLTVINRCVDAEGRVREVRGVAKIVDPASNARLKVSFVSFLGIRPFWGDYWVLGLGDDYEYVVVGTPDRKYGWILARAADPGAATIESAKQVLKNQGYDVARFQFHGTAAS
ncbi:MAG: lipocalin family protein [Candidatus Eisenbacteria bacterium]|nr:lipocalin family protein [Candidatus Eisenbacteria bacterium]